MSAKPIPDGYQAATPYLIVRDAPRAIEFYKQAFGAEETLRLEQPDGKIGHAELKIGTAPIMLADEFPDLGFVGPETLGGSPVALLIYCEDAGELAERAVNAGATVVKPVMEQFYGDRMGTIRDPFGHMWSIATREEDVSPEEIQHRFQELLAEGGEDAG